jgi:hypothetical protein
MNIIFNYNYCNLLFLHNYNYYLKINFISVIWLLNFI